jgi:excisionase family DNA binding protein
MDRNDEKIASERAVLTADEAWKLIGGTEVISRGGWFNAINRKEVPSLRVGRRILIPRHALMEWLASARPSTPTKVA